METIDAVIEINRIFKANKWTEKDKDELVFNGFCNLFTELEPDQRKLILELTKNYCWISQGDYQDGLLQAMESISGEEVSEISKIHFFPIIKPEDEIKNKSGNHLLYIIKSFKHLMKKYKNIHFEYLTQFDALQRLEIAPDERLFLIDDYIGSGDTLDFCMAELRKNTRIASGSIKVVCIAIQEETQINLVLDGYGVLKSIVVKKGISDYNVQPQIDQKKDLMREIERNIPGAKLYSLGYKETEALITLMRTPDNTFPIFWSKFRKNGKLFDAPFARYDE
jgi:hypothetical protein